MKALEKKIKELRKAILGTICNGGGGHIPASLSIVEILAVLYNHILKIDPKNPRHPGRDRFILSKGHACVALYAVLAERGFFDKKLLAGFGRKGSILGGHPDMHKIPGVEASTGALGHGFPFGVGVALAGRMDGQDYRVFVLLGDGECQEGSVWEAALFAAQHKMDNLTAIIDYNKLQAMGRLDEIVGLEPLGEKWRAFGWEVREVNGHDPEKLKNLFKSLPFRRGRPSMIIAHTIKGKGISFMENVPIWHFRMPSPKEIEIICNELEMEMLEGPEE